jgi:hypothetical protein
LRYLGGVVPQASPQADSVGKIRKMPKTAVEDKLSKKRYPSGP